MLNKIIHYYIKIFKYREKRFGYKIDYNYLPKEYDKTKFPVMLDPFWFSHGFLGFGIFYVPKGKEFSERYNEQNALWESWIGHYFINLLKSRNFNSPLEEAKFLALAGLQDQRFWLKSFGIKNPEVYLKGGIELVKNIKLKNDIDYTIYSGKIVSNTDDAGLKRNPITISKLSSIAASEYSGSKPTVSLQMDTEISKNEKVNLIGYFGIIKLTNKKYIVNYACVREEAFEEYKDELLKVLESIELEKLN